ncbi:zinc finger protein 625-like [Anoplophora glabripennis]|uniref:zinc finger protein 625-like n=1 Tax=Anoplophora glabripennis TaxID=217634 RepID=UPI0008742BD9|nr:zinc finger protein 625-like [Anoplophora glabripennis]
MTFIKNMEDIKGLCRICLTSSENMISLNDNLDDKTTNSPLIIDVLENLLVVKVDGDVDYPIDVCHLCRGNLRILYDLKIMFNKSQNILRRYISSLQQFDVMDPLNNSNILTLSSYKNEDSMSSTASPAGMNEIENDSSQDNDLSQDNGQKKSVRIQVATKKPKIVTVKWLNGNKFLIENTKKSFKCTHCNKVFPSEEQHLSHSRTCKKNISCKFCKNTFYSERSLRCHLRMHHHTNPPLEIKCEICNKTFKNYNARSYHKITRHNTEGKKYSCEVCGKAFYFKNSLSQHLECHSRDVSRVVCPICGKSFHYRGGLFYHMKIHRNERNYVCSFCNGKFLNMASLKRHTRIHTGERPYTCTFCPKTFCSISEVRTHERRHTGQKPHKCKYCPKRFITPYNLKLHTSSHTGTKPCGICRKSYLNAEVLKYHMEMKHNIKEVAV